MNKYKFTNKCESFVVSAKSLSDACAKAKIGDMVVDAVGSEGRKLLEENVRRPSGFAEYGNKLDYLSSREEVGVRVAQPRLSSGVLSSDDAKAWATHLIMFAESLESLSMHADKINQEVRSLNGK